MPISQRPAQPALDLFKHPVTHALVSMTQTFIDTIIVCTMTGLVLILTGAWDSGITGAELTTFAFQNGIAGGGLIVTIGLLMNFNVESLKDEIKGSESNSLCPLCSLWYVY